MEITINLDNIEREIDNAYACAEIEAVVNEIAAYEQRCLDLLHGQRHELYTAFTLPKGYPDPLDRMELVLAHIKNEYIRLIKVNDDYRGYADWFIDK